MGSPLVVPTLNVSMALILCVLMGWQLTQQLLCSEEMPLIKITQRESMHKPCQQVIKTKEGPGTHKCSASTCHNLASLIFPARSCHFVPLATSRCLPPACLHGWEREDLSSGAGTWNTILTGLWPLTFHSFSLSFFKFFGHTVQHAGS